MENTENSEVVKEIAKQSKVIYAETYLKLDAAAATTVLAEVLAMYIKSNSVDKSKAQMLLDAFNIVVLCRMEEIEIMSQE